METIAPGVDNTKATHLPAVPPPKPATLPNEPTTPTPPRHLPNVPYNLRPRTSRPHYAAPSPTAKPAGLWSTGTSSQTPPHVPPGSTQPPTKSGASHKVSQTSGSNLPTRCSLFLSLRSPNTNDLPMPALSAATVPKKLNLTAHKSRLAAT